VYATPLFSDQPCPLIVLRCRLQFAKQLAMCCTMQASLQKQIAGELEWLQQSANGQQKKGKARLRRYDDLVEEVRSMLCWMIYHRIHHVIYQM
jgi:hypothetical protein